MNTLVNILLFDGKIVKDSIRRVDRLVRFAVKWVSKVAKEVKTDSRRISAGVLEDDPATAINEKGFKVEFLRRVAEQDDDHPVKLSGKKIDLYAVQARRASVLTNAAPFEHIVVSSTGRMATMRTIDPKVFVEFKQWMGTNAQDRPSSKRRRDLLQAGLVQSLMDDGLLLTDTERMTESRLHEDEASTTTRPGI